MAQSLNVKVHLINGEQKTLPTARQPAALLLIPAEEEQVRRLNVISGYKFVMLMN
jgi:hypothetical protein